MRWQRAQRRDARGEEQGAGQAQGVLQDGNRNTPPVHLRDRQHVAGDRGDREDRELKILAVRAVYAGQ